MESKVTALEEQIGKFTERANHTTLQVQDIAIKAIEGASRQRYLHVEKTSESNRSTTN